MILENLQRETELLDILQKNIHILTKSKYKKLISKELEGWLDDKEHPIWTKNFKSYLENFLNDNRRKKLNRILGNDNK